MKQLIVTDILRQFFPELTEKERLYDLFQQDSTTAHTVHMSMQYLMCSGTKLPAMVFGQHIHPTLILVIFSSDCLRDKVYNSKP
jgi:hypothetical protein